MGRATATVLFTDLVGSTELRSRVGEEAAEELRRTHDRLLALAVEANGGRVVKGLGDGIMATFAGASDAVAAAVAIQQAVDRQNRSAKAVAAIEVRVGISAGDVTVEDEDVHGTPVIEAARLCGVAAGGEILASEMVRWLARSSAAAAFTPVGNLELKGLPEAVPAVRVGWEPLAASTIPMPALLTDVGRIFVGRESEYGRLEHLWKEAAAGERRVALLAGEPGVGKTRLAAELAARVHEEGSTVLAGRCDEDMGVPYQPFVEALRHFIDHTASEQLRERIGRYGGELARLVPELTGQVTDLPPPLESDPETERYRLFDAIAAWLAAASAEQPLLLVLDDLQWAAKPTLLLLRHVLRASEATRVLVVVTYRDTDIGRGHPFSEFLADLRRDGAVARYSLVGLDRAAVGAYIEAAAGHALPEEGEDFARAVWEETEGNPFFVAEVLRHLAECGAIEQRDGRWTTTAPVEELGIPEGVRDVVGRRLARLAADTDRVLGVASVVGLEFEPAVVGAGGGFGEDQLFSALEEAAAARLLTEVSGGRFRFAHALVRATLYDELSGPRRTAVHRRVAEAIETVHGGALDDHLPALAHHWARASATAADTRRAIEYAARAGDRALAQLANDEAAAYYRQAIELLEISEGPADEGQHLELLISLGEAQRRAGDPSHRETLLAAAQLAGERRDASALARAALANSRGVLFTTAGRVDTEKVSVLEDALRAVDTRDSPIRARLLAGLGLELAFADARERRVALSDEALALAHRLGDPETLSHVLLARYSATMPSSLEERLVETSELLRVIDAVSDPVTRSRAWSLGYRVAVEAGDVVEADRCLERAERLAVEMGEPAVRWMLSFLRVGREVLAGRFESAEHLALEARDLGRWTGQEADWVFAVQMYSIRGEQGRLDDEVESLLRAAFPEVRLPLGQSCLAVLYCELGRVDAARDVMAGVLSESLPVNIYWLAVLCNCSTAVGRIPDHAQAQRLHELLHPYAHWAVPLAAFPMPCVAHHLGLLATVLERLDEAESRFVQAATTHERIRAPAWLARTRLEWARMLLARRQPGDAEQARELLGQALATARELGLGGVERRAVALLQESG